MVKSKFSRTWKRSKQPRKQRKYRYNAPLHTKTKFMASHLSKELKEKHKKRSATVRKGDKVKILRGQFKGNEGKVDRVDIKKTRVYVTGIESVKKDGTKTFYPIHPSNLLITELSINDKKRKSALERK